MNIRNMTEHDKDRAAPESTIGREAESISSIVLAKLSK